MHKAVLKFTLLSALWLGLLATSGGAEEPRAGLMWNKTGLPAVFPLQVKTAPGQDFMMTLVDAQTHAPALAAFIEGGEFFKVLVPPGEYDVRFATGAQWRGEAELFGKDETTLFVLDGPLRFAVMDFATKLGHVIDFTASDDAIMVKAQFICQRFSVAEFARPQPPFDDLEGYATRLTQEGELVQFPNRFAPDRLSAGTDDPVIPTDFAPYFSDPAYEVRAFPC
ncbi:hypothetical protein CEP88_13710 [Roseobacter denitrificans]|nr:hypothetical protein CEP88_13710 [Roseobacter denitrificans]SFF72382.1 hypothetical protein SAMN05443635_101412 [Roseobacter denitrificans OCh 114]